MAIESSFHRRGSAVDIKELGRQLAINKTLDSELIGGARVSQGGPEESFRIPKQKLPKYLIHPDSKKLGWFELCTAMLLLYIAIATPVEVAFMPAPTRADDPWFVMGRFIDFVFIVEMVLQFFIMTWRTDDPSKVETSLKVISTNYLNGWFTIDVFSIAASAFDIIPIAMGNATGPKSPLSSFRVVRILRLAKLIRLLRASKRLKDWSVRLATPQSIVTVVSTLIECVYIVHIFACTFGMMTIVPESPLDTWYATHGYCRPGVNGSLDENNMLMYECVDALYLYLQCFWWAAGMLMGAPISLSPNKGPWDHYYANAARPVLLTVGETCVVLTLKAITAFEWVTVIARFVNVYNNLDPDARDFRMGWDALNRFVTYFKVGSADAQELRRYYIERAEQARAKSRKRVMNDFSPYLAEKFVWKLNKEWLIRVPCFSLVVERLVLRPESGMERFLVEVALSMQPSVFVPSERPPARRLYIIVDGEARHKGVTLRKGMSWGAEDVLLTGQLAKNKRAHAMSYLHVLWVDADSIVQVGKSHRTAFLLTKLWATVYCCGEVIVEDYRREHKSGAPVHIGEKAHQITPMAVEQKINAGFLTVMALKRDNMNGKPQQIFNADGKALYVPRYKSVHLGEYEITESDAHSSLRRPKGAPPTYFQVRPKALRKEQPDDPDALEAAPAELDIFGAGACSDRSTPRVAATLSSGLNPTTLPNGDAVTATDSSSTSGDNAMSAGSPIRMFQGFLGGGGGERAVEELRPLLESLIAGQTRLHAAISNQAMEQQTFMKDMRVELNTQKQTTKVISDEVQALRKWVTTDVLSKLRA